MPKKHLTEEEMRAMVNQHFWQSAGMYENPFETLRKSEFTMPFSQADQSLFDPSTKPWNLSQVKINKNNKIIINLI